MISDLSELASAKIIPCLPDFGAFSSGNNKRDLWDECSACARRTILPAVAIRRIGRKLTSLPQTSRIRIGQKSERLSPAAQHLAKSAASQPPRFRPVPRQPAAGSSTSPGRSPSVEAVRHESQWRRSNCRPRAGCDRRAPVPTACASRKSLCGLPSTC